MQIISQGNDYIVQFDLYSDLANIANNVIGELSYNNTQLTLVSMTVTPTIGTQSTLNPNQYLFGTVLPNKHYAVACVFTVLQESPLIPITWTISTSNPETTLVNNSKTINLVTYLDGLLASDICSNLQGCVVSARVRFLQVLPSGEWLWENYNPIGNIQLSTFTTPATGAQTITSTDSSVTVSGSDLSVIHTVNPDGSITLNDGTVIPAPTTVAPETITTLVNNNNGTATYTNEANVPVTFPIGSTTLVNNSDGTYTFTAADGTTVTISDTSLSTLVDNGNNSFTYTDEAGVPVTFTVAADILTAITNTVTGNKIADYTDELGTVTPINETVTSIVNNSDGTATYTDESGTSITFPIGGATLVDNGNGTITYTSESGTVTTFNEGFTSFVNSANGFTATYPNGSTYVWSETITALAAATDGFSYTSENGTVTTVTYLFDNATPASPTLLVQVNGTTQASIPLNSYDVNITTSGGFTFNPTTDQITITETDGETHVIDLTPLRTTLTSVDNSVEIVPSVNPDGSTNYDLGVKTHTNQVETVPYTGVELPSIIGVNIGDTTDAQFSDGTIVSYTWDGTTWIPDFQQTWAEQRICLNTAAVAFTPADLNNPLVSEVDAWATANLTIQQRENGTKLVYFVAGDGGSCDVPDYTWTLNKGSQLVTLTNKRVFNTKTVYVDAGSGSDVTGRRGYREFPFKTLDAAIAVTQTGDLLKVFPGTYTQTSTIQNLININCDYGVDWTFTGNFFNNTPDRLLDVTTTWTFDVLRSTLTTTGTTIHNLGIKNSLGKFILNANKLEYVYHTANNAIKQRSINVKNLISSYIVASSLSPTVDGVAEINLDYYERTITNNSALLIGSQMSDNSKLITRIKNLKSINSTSGYGNTPTIGYYFSSDTGINKQYTTIIDNVTHDNPNIYVTPPGPLASATAWTGVSTLNYVGKLYALASPRQGSTYTLDIKSIKSTGHGVHLSLAGNESTIIVNIKGVFEKGIPIFCSNLNTAINTKVIINLDVECYTSMGVFIGFADGSVDLNNISASNQVVVTGRIKTRYAGMSCISIGTGSNPLGNNTNGTILLKDLTLINDSTVSPIMCGVPENVQIQNVVSNSLVSDPNILEVGQSIIRNTNYK